MIKIRWGADQAIRQLHTVRLLVVAIFVTAVFASSGFASRPAHATGDPWFERREIPIAISADEYLVLVHERRSPGSPPTVTATLSWQRFDLVTNRLTELIELRRDEGAWNGVHDAPGDAPEMERTYEADATSASLSAALDAFGGKLIGPSTPLDGLFRLTRDGVLVGDAGDETRVLEPSVLGRRFEEIDVLFNSDSMTVLALYRARHANLVLIRGTGSLGTQEIVLGLPPIN